MAITLSVPARINILGNPADGNEGDFATISAAVDIRAYATIQQAGDIILGMPDSLPAWYPHSIQKLPFDGVHDLLIAAINRLDAFSPEFHQKRFETGFELVVRSDVPRQSGLGGSSLFVILTLAALREHYRLDLPKHNDYLLAELAQRVEAKELGIAAGYADRYVPFFGGLAYIDYRGKLAQGDIRGEPMATYERLDRIASYLNLVAVTTGLYHDSGDVHGRMRPRYLQEHAEWQKMGGEMPPMVRFMSAAWDCAWRGKIALLEGDLSTFGGLMNRNHHVVDEMMRYCGFTDGAGWANNLFIEKAIRIHALGAKLTGAGSGGSVFALVRPGDEDELVELWQQTAAENGLINAEVIKLVIANVGLRIEKQSVNEIN